MSVHELRGLLPESRSISNVFDVTTNKYNLRLETLRDVYAAVMRKDSRLQPFFRDTIDTGVAYFALRGHDSVMREMGRTLHEQLTSGFAQTFLVSDVKATAKDFGYPQAYIDAADPNGPLTVVSAFLGVLTPRDFVHALIPAGYLLGVSKSPLEVLEYIAEMGSMVRDAAHNRATVDHHLFTERAMGFGARFIRHVMQTEPTVRVPEYYREILATNTEERFQQINYRTPLIPLNPRVN